MAGFWSVPDGAPPGDASARAEAVLRAMCAGISRRGPDSSGTWHDAHAGVGFGHRRLAIQDLSPAGHQPMVSACGRLVLCFNGEIYNHAALRRALADAGHPVAWRGDSDTESLLEAMACFGIEAALARADGMFAFAVFDVRARTLVLARDRFGEKPLYVGRYANTLVFGSELQALAAHPAFVAEIDPAALGPYMAYAAVPAPLSIYRDTVKLEPGCLLRVTDPSLPLPPQHPYWSLTEVAAAGAADPLQGSDAEMLDALEAALSRAVRSCLVADVPVGAFLSGGIDSSLVVAMMRRDGSDPVRTFTIGFEEHGFDEAPDARRVAHALGTEHTELYVDASAALALVPHLPSAYTEPFADPSQIPTCLVAEMTRRSVTVCLSGDGGDELFGGYGRYRDALRVWSRLERLPGAVRRPAAGLADALATGLGAASGGRLPGSLGRGVAHVGQLARLARTGDVDALYAAMTSSRTALRLLRDGGAAAMAAHARDRMGRGGPEPASALQRMMLADGLGYLPDTIMTKVDRASMRVGLEARAPLLDPALATLAWRLPDRMRVRDGVGKWALREVLYRHVPRELVDRPKAGFGVPLGAWLRGPLRDWAEVLLAPVRLRDEGHFDVAAVRRLWREHLSGTRDAERDLWQVLVFQAWLDGFHAHARTGVPAPTGHAPGSSFVPPCAA